MSDSVTLEKPTASSAETQQQIAAAAANFVKDPDAAVKRVPITVDEQARVKDGVKAKLAELDKVDIYSGDADGISKAFQDIFSRADANKTATAELANYFTKRNFRGAQDSTSFKAVTDLAAALQKYNPDKFDLTTPEGWLGKIPLLNKSRGIANYMRSFKEAQGQIEELMDGVASVAEDGVKAKEELKVFDAKLLKLAKELRVQYETFTELAKSVDEYLVDLAERDPMKADKVRDELTYRIAEARMDTLTTLLQAQNGSILVSSLVKTQDMIITGAARASSSGRLILTINQTTAASVSEQADAANLLGAVNDVIGTLTESNAKMVQEHVKKMKDLASSPIGQTDKLKAAFNMGFAALDDLKDVQKQVAARIETNITSLEGIYTDANARLNAESQATAAFGQVVAGSAELAKARVDAANKAKANSDSPAPPKVGM